MKIAYTYNIQSTTLTNKTSVDRSETPDVITTALEDSGHEVQGIDCSDSLASVIQKLEACAPDIIFNTAIGNRGRMCEAFYPSLFEELNIPFAGSDTHTLTVALDKSLTKTILAKHGVDTPRSILLHNNNMNEVLETNIGLSYPIIVKPNYEGSSKGITRDSVVANSKELLPVLRKALRDYPEGVLLEEFVDGVDISVCYISNVGHDNGLLVPVQYLVEPTLDNPYNVYDYKLKLIEPKGVSLHCPADIPRDLAARARAISHTVIKVLNIQDMACIDYRITENGRIYLLEANALPSLQKNSPLMTAAIHQGMNTKRTIESILHAAAIRAGIATKGELGIRRSRKKSKSVRIGFTYNIRRNNIDDTQAEWDLPETIAAISSALRQLGHVVVHLEATQDLPRVLAESEVDCVFNIAEGVEGRNREAQVPALCELLRIPYIGSDSATLAITLDKALAKKVLIQHDILTPAFQVMETGRERLNPDLKFPLIVKPNTEGSSKGINATSVVDNEEDLRITVKDVIANYRQPVLVEEYVVGREFTVGLLGDKRPRVLPPMEIRFIDQTNERPVYNYAIKQNWKEHVYYECPAKVDAAELKSIEKIAKATFWALDCRDVARIDLRVTDNGTIYVIEINPLPGLTPAYSDLVLIAQAAGMDYNTLIGEIIETGLRRFRRGKRDNGNTDARLSGRHTTETFA